MNLPWEIPEPSHAEWDAADSIARDCKRPPLRWLSAR